MISYTPRARQRAEALLELLELQRECTAPDLLREAQVRAVLEWARELERDRVLA